MNLENFLDKIKKTPETIEFKEVISMVDENYDFTPAQFKNGKTINEAGQNSGSCKLFAFAKMHELTPLQTLNCFGDYYRKDVLLNPEGADHQNIRNFMLSKWEGISFEADPLKRK